MTQRVIPTPDFRKLFESAPGLYLVLLPDFTIVAVSDAYTQATMTRREDIVGRGIFDVFPDNPEDPAADGVRNLRASLERVRRHCRKDTMPPQKYDIRRPQSEGGGFEVRYWSPTNSPVLEDGALAYIIHRVEDITDFVRLQQQLLGASTVASGTSGASPTQVEAEIYRRAQEIAAVNEDLRREHDKVSALLTAVADGVDDVILVKDSMGRYLSINNGGARLFRTSADNIIGRDDTPFFSPETVARIREMDQRILAEGGTRSFEEELELPEGKRTFLTTKGPYRDAEGNIIGVIGISKDISDRKRAEDEIQHLNADLEMRVAERTAGLESALRELEAFSYSVSHDLRTPLRSIDGFAKALMEDYAGSFDATASGYLTRVRAASQRMAELIDGMLELSRIARHEMHTSTVDLSQIARDVAADLERADPGRMGVEWILADGITVEGDARLLRTVMENLLGNAWKYSSQHEKARIEFGSFARKGDGATAYFVRDDGAGFDMTYSDKLFGAFQRMHGMGEFPGHGVGLATVHRIIRRHGGSIRAEAEVEKGATFYFTLWETAPG